MHTPLPYHIYVWIDNKHLGPAMPSGSTRGILHGVYSRVGQCLLTHVLLESGGHWSGLPLHALHHREGVGEQPLIEPWGGMGTAITATHLPLLEGLRGCTMRDAVPFGHSGVIIDWNDGYSRYPAEHKPLSLLLCDGGGFALLPNNYFRLYDKHFTAPLNSPLGEMVHYRRGEQVYWERE